MTQAYRFGEVEIRAMERQVLVGGRAAVLGSRAFDVLLALVERRDRVVTKNELLDLAWPGLVVEENNLQAQVSALRRVLGPRAIATIPGRGYRFAMAQDERPAQPAAGAPEPSSPSTEDLRRGLPLLPAGLIGRDDELAALDRLLDQHRLVTIAGAAGIGKTTLAIAVAESRLGRLRDGIVWAELAPIQDAALIAGVIAKALQVEAAPGADVTAPLVAALRSLEALLVIDTAEHLLEAVARLVDMILAQAPGVAVLVTSRSSLRLKAERLMRLGPLGVPEAGVTLEEARTFGAVALLEERARAVDPRFALNDENIAPAIEVCSHLDGIALAIELAAARLPLLGMRGLAERIGQRFRLLASSSPLVPTRQQTLLAALDWSHDLLSAEEQKVFRRLGVFAGDFPLALATAIARDETLDEWAVIDALGVLVDRSLVEVNAGLVPRYRLLESARAYALLKMSPEEAQTTNRVLATALLALFEVAERESWFRLEHEWIAAYGGELPNMLAALDWSTEHDAALAVALFGASRFLHSVHGLDFELYRRLEKIALLPDVRPPARVEADYEYAVAWIRRINSDHACIHALKAAALYGELGDDMMRFLTLCFAAPRRAGGEGRALADECATMLRPDWPPRVKYHGSAMMAMVASREGRVAETGMLFEQSLEHARACGSELLVRRSLGNLADHALAAGDVDKAVRLGRELVRQTHERRFNTLIVLGNLAHALLRAGEVAEARGTFAGWIEMSRAMGWSNFNAFSPILPLLAASEGRYESAAKLLGLARRRKEETGSGAQVNEQRAYDLSMAQVEKNVDAPTLQRLMDAGATLDEEAACALVLERAPTAPAAKPTPGSRRKLSA